ncbi:TIGR01212 family radical SAM protein [Aureliella helgolandensis]|uniref:Coproporphyrinogen III oxidase n=1 Tax=Aureliella helgolandensis TaxID=2527968 RepID=A0A518G7Y7_9BACT|nr:TIGR01212 family radical SAM protein [Aureliella helgolandensis]QDV24692.1 coproporphyrinogen III oxidase [Aureliella helgolandensis]
MTTSIFSAPDSEFPAVDWRSLGHRYYPLNLYLKQRFGGRVQKISLDGGFTCPNVDGTVAKGGCVFCDNRSFSPSRRVRRDAIASQIQRGIDGLRRRYDTEKFLAYFQPATNTYGPLDKLRTLWETALEDERVVGLVIGTRPDCVPDDVLELVDEFAEHKYVSLELGVQTVHDASLEWMNRGHGHAAAVEAMQRVTGRKFEISLHIMLGLPGESHEMMMATADQVAAWQPAAVKIHNLYAVERTELADQVRSGEVTLMELDEYIEVLADFLERLPPDMVIERISGDAPPSNLVAPQWCLNKGTIKQRLVNVMEARNTFQGSAYQHPSPAT